MKNIFVLCCIALLALGSGSCKKNPVEPPDEEENLTPGRRDYVWTVDTLKTHYVHLHSTWGTTPNEIYTMGWGGGDRMWRYQNGKWSIETRISILDPINAYVANEKVWICSMQGQIWSFTNGVYKKELDIWLDKNEPVCFYDIDGKSENEMFASAQSSSRELKNGLLFKYNGSVWSVYKTFENSGGFNSFRYSKNNNKYYCNGLYYNNDGTIIEKVYEFDGNNLKLLNEHYKSSEMNSALHIIQGYIYITLGKKAYRYSDNKMELMFEVNDPNFGGQLWGRSRNDILIRMFDGIAHYDGTGYKYLLKVTPNVCLSAQAKVFEKEVFIPAQDYKSGYQLMYHGVLKE